MVGFKPNLTHFSFLKFLYKKHIFRIFWGLSGGRRGRFYKKLSHISYYKIKYIIKIIQKLDPCGHFAGLYPYIHLQI